MLWPYCSEPKQIELVDFSIEKFNTWAHLSICQWVAIRINYGIDLKQGRGPIMEANELWSSFEFQKILRIFFFLLWTTMLEVKGCKWSCALARTTCFWPLGHSQAAVELTSNLRNEDRIGAGNLSWPQIVIFSLTQPQMTKSRWKTHHLFDLKNSLAQLCMAPRMKRSINADEFYM